MPTADTTDCFDLPGYISPVDHWLLVIHSIHVTDVFLHFFIQLKYLRAKTCFTFLVTAKNHCKYIRRNSK